MDEYLEELQLTDYGWIDKSGIEYATEEDYLESKNDI